MSDSSDPRGSDPNLEGPAEPRVDELAQLARRAPDKIRDHLEKLPLARQAEIAAQLPARERLELLLHAPLPMRLVRTLPDGDLYLTIREVGPADALPLLALASAPQLLHLIDLESWRRDQFDPERSGAWIAMLLEAGEEVLQRFLRDADDDLLVLLFQKWARVRQIEIDDTPDRAGHGETEAGTDLGFLSPDGYHRFSPLIPEHGPAIRRLAEVFAARWPERCRRVVWSAVSEPSAEVEEQALRWRQSRLEEHGFAPWEEALSVYAPPVRSREPAPTVVVPADPAAAPGALLRWADAGGGLVQALGRLDDARRTGALHEIASLANRVLVVDASDTGDPDAHRAAMKRVASYLRIGLQTRGARDAPAAAGVMAEAPMIELFREGYERAVAVQGRARALAASGWASVHPEALRMLDPPLGPAIEGLLMPRPLHFDPRAASAAEAYRDFRSLEEIEEAGVAVSVADTLGRVFVDRLGVDVSALLAAEDDLPHGALRFSTLFLTALAWSATRGELRGDPLPPEVTAQFLRTVVSRRTADPESAPRALREFLDRLVTALGLAPAEHTALRAFGTACLERLGEECSMLDPGASVDPRYVSCLLLSPAAR
jgi:hypothetical protein